MVYFVTLDFEMSLVYYRISGGAVVLSSRRLVPPSSTPSLTYQSEFQKQSTATPVAESSSGSKISPPILVIIVVLAVVFFISGLLHLLVRYLMRHRSSSSISESSRYPDMSGSDAYQRQLQQLFHLHDSGLDQTLIDALPIFLYKEIIGLKEPFDCAVCLCEFTELDKLRLLPSCNHAFHLDCIDTWLMSNSTCPLCRGTLYAAGLVIENPVFDFEDPTESGFSGNGGSGDTNVQKPPENHITIGKRVFSVRLGKFTSSNYVVVERQGESSTSNLDARRCYSMGSCQYVVADSDLQVVLCRNRGESSRHSKDRPIQNGDSSTMEDAEGKKLKVGSKGESFSVSKVWLWSKKGKSPSSSESQLGNSAFVAGLPLTNKTQLTLR